jgi:hypothetical protein
LKTLGLRTFWDKVAWASVDGDHRTTASVTDSGALQIPVGGRGEQLCWVRKELGALIAQEKADAVVLCPTEGATVSNALIERAQVDGVVLEALHDLAIPTHVKKSATIRATFGARSKAQLASSLAEIPTIAGIPPTAARREPAVAAISNLPD